MRSTEEEKLFQIRSLEVFSRVNEARHDAALDDLRQTALSGGNIFASLMEAVKSCSLGQISAALYEVGGQYRRNM
jgi:methylmalonyl-CoA mutase